MGGGKNQREVHDNGDVAFMCHLIRLIVAAGGWVTVENPLSSYMKYHPDLRSLLDDGTLRMIVFDQCQYGLRAPKGAQPEVWKKPTFLLATHGAFEKLARRCPGHHVHTPIQGSVRVHGRHYTRSALASKYPSKLCHAYCACAVAICEGQDASSGPHRRAQS